MSSRRIAAGIRRAASTTGLVAVLALLVPTAALAGPLGNPTDPAKRDTEPVILKGSDFAAWSVPANFTAKLPLLDFPESFQCFADDSTCDHHNDYAKPEVDSSVAGPQGTTPVERLLGYRWDADRRRFEQIPFQVDEMFVRYLDNSGSGFAFYSGQDKHLTYAFDREGFRFWQSDANDPCLAKPDGPATTPDPVGGLDDDDELAFMASDAGPAAPLDAKLPTGVEDSRQVQVSNPYDPGQPRYVYVMRAAADGPRSAFADGGYVDYRRDANADLFEKSESSYEGYGNARKGVVCDAQGNVLRNADGSARIERRRPRDYATITTPRYRFRYDGRWLMTDVRISPDGGETYGPDLVDRWKARAFQQDPSSETPCCGYEEEDTNWGGSSTLLGEREGPVRAIRETWGADSGTNVIRRETFYRDEMRQKSFLRVHVIPPLDGIYAQWDFNAGVMDRFYSSSLTNAHPEGVAVDGRNDEALGNLDDPCNPLYDPENNPRGTSEVDQAYRDLYEQVPGLCSPTPVGGQQLPYHQSIDVPDFTRSELNAGHQWNVTTGEQGTIVDRYQIDDVTEQSAGGLAQASVLAVPYYRDDSCFDDGTGTDPGPRVRLRSSSEPRTYRAPDGSTQSRTCWDPADGPPGGSERFFQGAIATHGLHILLVADSDNARQTVPVTEMVAEQRMVMLPGRGDGAVGEQYGRGFEKPLATAVTPEARAVVGG